MKFYAPARMLGAAAVLIFLSAGLVSAQPKTSMVAMSTARQILELKGGLKLFDPIIGNVIERNKMLLLQANPMMSRDLDEVAAKLRGELEPRRLELQNELVSRYAQAFSDQELKDALAFFKSPLGRKLTDQEPKILESSMKWADEWTKKLVEEVVQKLRAELKKKGHNL